MRFFNIPVFLLIFFSFFSISSFAVDCDDAFLFPGSKLYYADKVIRSGLIEESRRLFPSFVDPIKERALVNKWNERVPAPPLLEAALPDGVYFLKHQQYQPGSQTAVKLHEPGDALIARASYIYEGREFHANVVFSIRALQSNMNTGKKWLVRPGAKAAYLFLHGGGTKSTGSHVGSGQVTHLRKYDVDVVSVDLGWHAQGHREFLYFESEIKAIAVFVQKYFPPNVPVFVGGHSYGSIFSEKLMTMTDRPREEFFFHENLKAAFIFSTAVDAAPGKSMKEKEEAFSRIEIDINHNRQDEMPEAEKDLNKKIILAGKLSPLGNWYASGMIWQLDQSPPVHKGREYIPVYVAVGYYDGLVNSGGFKDLYAKRYDKRHGGLLNVKDYKVLNWLRHRNSEDKNDPSALVKVGHMLSDVRSEDGREDNLQYALTKDWIQSELAESAVKELKTLIIEHMKSSSLDLWTQNRISRKLEELSSLEEINWFIYTDSYVQQLKSSSLDLIKKSIVEKAESSALTSVTGVSNSIRELIRQQLELSSLDEKAKSNIAQKIDEMTSVETVQYFVNRPDDPNIQQFVEGWNPSFRAAVDTLIDKKLNEHKWASIDSPFIRVVQNFANDMAFREYQEDYTYYAHKGNMREISIRNAKILEEIAVIVKPYYSPGMRVMHALVRLQELEREALEKLEAVREELNYITDPDYLKRIPHPEARMALLNLKDQVQSDDHQMEDIAIAASNIMELKTQRGDSLFTNQQTGHVKRTKEFTKYVREGKHDEVIKAMKKMGLSDADHNSLTLLLRELSFNKELERGYFTLRRVDLKVEGIDPDKVERIDHSYEKLMSIDREWRSLENWRTFHSQALGVLWNKHEELLQRVRKDIKTIRDALDGVVSLLPPDSLRGEFQWLEDNAEKMVSAKELLDKVLYEKAAQIFQNHELDSLEITRVLQEQKLVIDNFSVLYDQHVQNRTEYNRRAIVAMEQGELESRLGVEERSLKEAAISLYISFYRARSREENPVLTERDKADIEGRLERIRTAKEIMMIENPQEGEPLLREAVASLYAIGSGIQDPVLLKRKIEETLRRIKTSLKAAVISLYGVGSRGESPVLTERDKADIEGRLERIRTAKEMMIENPQEGELLLREAVASLYAIGSGIQDPVLLEKKIKRTMKRIKASKGVSEEMSERIWEFEETQLRIDMIEQIGGYLALDYVVTYLAKLEAEQIGIENQSIRNRTEYFDSVRHLTNLIPKDARVHTLLQQALQVVNPQRIPIKDILFYSNVDKTQELKYIHNHSMILSAFIKQWGDLRSAFLPFLPTIYE